MSNIKLIDNESIIKQSGNDLITLTNFRLLYNDSTWGSGHISSIMLEKISSVEIHHKGRPVFIILALITLLAFVALAAAEEIYPDAFPAYLVIAGVFLLIYFFTRNSVVTITSDGGSKINFSAQKIGKKSLLEFMNQIDLAKLKRLANPSI